MDPRSSFQWSTVPGPWYKISPPFWLAFWSALILGSVTHLYMFTNFLPNHDSIHSIFYDNDVLSSGRWSAQLLSSLSTNFELPVVTGLISILALAVTAGLTVRVLGLTYRSSTVLVSALLVTVPSLSGIFSYLFTADAYCLALLLNALAVWCAKKYRWGWAAAILMMAVACGTYQAFICYAIGLFLIDCILSLLEGEETGKVVRRGLIYIGVCLASLVLYYVILKILLLITHTQLTEYQGLSGISLSNLPSYLMHIPVVYQIFFEYLLTPDFLDPFYRAVLQIAFLYLIAAVIWLAALKRIFRDPPRLLLITAGLLLLPLALNFVSLLTTEDSVVHHLMIYSFVLVFVPSAKLTELIVDHLRSANKAGWSIALWPGLVLCALLVWCGFYTNNVSYLRMDLRYENSVALANRIAARVEILEGYCKDTPIAIIGQLPYNTYGMTAPALSDLEPITGTDGALLQHYYSGRDVMEYCIGMKMPVATKEQWDAVYFAQIVDTMPCWPAEGSVTMYAGMAIVKLSEVYIE